MYNYLRVPTRCSLNIVEGTVCRRCNPAQYGPEYLSHGQLLAHNVLALLPTPSTETFNFPVITSRIIVHNILIKLVKYVYDSIEGMRLI